MDRQEFRLSFQFGPSPSKIRFKTVEEVMEYVAEVGKEWSEGS